MKRYLVPILLTVAYVTVTILAQPADAQEQPIPVYDTAWQLPTAAPMHEVDEYFAHLSEAGFTGAWISVLDLMENNYNVDGNQISGWEGSNFWISDAHKDRLQNIAQLARHHGIKIGVVPAWGLSALHANTYKGCDNAGLHQGPLNYETARGYGWNVGDALKDYTDVIGLWIAGGDNFCARGDAYIWQMMIEGVEDGANTADIPVGFHTPALPNRQLDFADEYWVDLMLPQTGHCASPEKAAAELAAVKAATGKPVWAGELRYLAIEPEWNCELHGPGRPVTPDDVAADAWAAVGAGVDGLSYGVNGRWQWGDPIHGSIGGDQLARVGDWSEAAVIEAAGGRFEQPEPVAPNDLTAEELEEQVSAAPNTLPTSPAEAEAAGALPRPDNPADELADRTLTEEPIPAASTTVKPEAVAEPEAVAADTVTPIREKQNNLLLGIGIVVILIFITISVRQMITDWRRTSRKIEHPNHQFHKELSEW